MSSVLERVSRSLSLRTDPAAWVRATQINHDEWPAKPYEPDPWQVEVLSDNSRWRAMCCGRQVGKSKVVGWDVGHHVTYFQGAVTLLVSKALRQSKQLMKYVKRALYDANTKFEKDNEFDLELANGAEVHALPGSSESIRGFSRITKLLIDEAAFCSDELYYAVEPMVNICRGQITLLSSADATFGFFYRIMEGEDPKWNRYRVTAYQCPRYDKDELDHKRLYLPDRIFKREYLAEFVDPMGTLIPEDLRKKAVLAMDDPLDYASHTTAQPMEDLVV